MSRVGQSPVVVPDGVSIEILDGILTAKGKLGAQSLPISGEVNVAIEDNIVTVSPKNNSKRSRSMWGTTRASINNMLTGCLLYTSPSPRDQRGSRMPSCA